MSPRGTKTTFLSLVVMTAAFFVPAVRSCNDEPFKSPAEYAIDSPLMFTWVAPVFIAAALMALLTVRVLATHGVERGVRRGALVTIAMLAALNTGGTSWFLAVDNFPQWWWLALAVLGTVAAGALVRRARGRDPLAIWDHLVAAFGCVALTSGPAVFLGGWMLAGETSDMATGAYLFVGATALLWATSLRRALVGATK